MKKKIDWDYSQLAESYLKRADYPDAAIDRIVAIAGLKPGASVCDIGAGTGNLSVKLLERNLRVTCIEPNSEMRRLGVQQTETFSNVEWIDATGEQTGLRGESFDLIAFGSSFNVLDRASALAEARRLLRREGWFVCLWNHRDVSDVIQSEIEEIIRKNVPSYQYGTRREDQTPIIEASGLFKDVIKFDTTFIFEQKITDYMTAWQSHATLFRQAGSSFDGIVSKIRSYLLGLHVNVISVPYQTKVWMAQSKS